MKPPGLTVHSTSSRNPPLEMVIVSVAAPVLKSPVRSTVVPGHADAEGVAEVVKTPPEARTVVVTTLDKLGVHPGPDALFTI